MPGTIEDWITLRYSFCLRFIRPNNKKVTVTRCPDGSAFRQIIQQIQQPGCTQCFKIAINTPAKVRYPHPWHERPAAIGNQVNLVTAWEVFCRAAAWHRNAELRLPALDRMVFRGHQTQWNDSSKKHQYHEACQGQAHYPVLSVCKMPLCYGRIIRCTRQG